MAFGATVRKLLISCPGDVPASDLEVIRKAINRWNFSYGEQFAGVVIPVSWGSNAAAEFGKHPQVALNDQLVDGCDICIALFANRLGTETPNAESGTVEEIERLNELGRYVGILRSVRPVNPSSIELEQAGRLKEYLGRLRASALVLEYADDADLHSHVDAILNAAVSRDSARAEMQLQETETTNGSQSVAELWPRVVSEDSVDTDPKGRVKTRKHWYLVLANTGSAAALNVSFETVGVGESDEPWMVMSDDDPIESIAPGGDIRFNIVATMGSPLQVRCTVRWDDSRGTQENVATLRLA